ncbi:Hypothetical predicted protein [Lecanosticta acicola]|uniref:Uncharacterized protein n=1 Tax=Lecanosticta acicola TaxID=111012 RepID=A0AAI8Z8N5_9PEZI|nr:Hypothetical predicted protein [Lecanosticta acicola]
MKIKRQTQPVLIAHRFLQTFSSLRPPLDIKLSTTKVLLILGAGSNVGASVAAVFAQARYKIALAARKLQDAVDKDGQLRFQSDLADAESVDSAFDKVSATFGPPNVIVYNAASAKLVSADDPLELSLANFNQDVAVNTGSVLVAAQRAVQGFRQLSSGIPKTFIYTGNFLNKEIMPRLISNGM